MLPRTKAFRKITLARLIAGACASAVFWVLTWMPCPAFAGPARYETKEYKRTYGLSRIKASHAYTRGYNGSKVTVAVLDSGIDSDHSEFKGQIASGGYDFVNKDSRPEDDFGHGTAVSGIVAARKDGKGMHGVAYRAKILPIKVMDGNGDVDDLTSYYGIRHAITKKADILNLSYGGLGTHYTTSALNRAVKAGKIIVTSAGNEGWPFPTDPAYWAGYSWAKGQIIAVGSVNTKSKLSRFSNRAGYVNANYYLVAPGEKIYATHHNGRYKWENGTSLSAPYVSGCAALLKQRYPHLTARQIVDILLTTATDLGAAGVDIIYGRGMVNIQAALQPQGALSVPAGTTVNGNSAPLRNTELSLSRALGDQLKGEVFARAIVLDKYDRAFSVDLTETVAPGRMLPLMEAALTSDSRKIENVSYRMSESNRLSATLIFEPAEPFSEHAGTGDIPTTSPVASQLIAETEYGTAGFGRNVNPNGFLMADRFSGGQTIRFVGYDTLKIPFLSILDTADIYSYQKSMFSEDLRLNLSYSEDDRSFENRRTAWTGGFEWTHIASSLGLMVGATTEDESILGGSGNGALTPCSEASTYFTALTGHHRLSDRLDISGTISYGATRVRPFETGLFKDFSTLQSISATLAAGLTGLFDAGDSLGFAVSCPLYLIKGETLVDVPVGRTQEGAVTRERAWMDLTPESPQIDVEFFYGRKIGRSTSISANLLTVFNKGHRSSASPELAGTVQVRFSF